MMHSNLARKLNDNYSFLYICRLNGETIRIISTLNEDDFIDAVAKLETVSEKAEKLYGNIEILDVLEYTDFQELEDVKRFDNFIEENI